MGRKYLINTLLLISTLVVFLIVGCTSPAPSPTPTQTPTATPAPTASPKPSPTTSPTATAKPSPTQPAKAKEWIESAAPETSAGYKDGQVLVRVANLALQKANIPLTLKNVASPGSTVNHRLYDKGEADMLYQSTVSVKQAWTNGGPFVQEPLKHKSYQGVYMFSADQFAVVLPANKDKYTSYADFAGKKFFPQVRGAGAYEASQMVLTALGLWDKMKDTQMGAQEVAGALRSGALDMVIHTTTGGGRSQAPWRTEMIATTDLWIVNPTDKEKEIIVKVDGMTPLTFPAEWAFGKKDPGTKEIWTYAYYQGWNFPSYGTEDEVYTIVKSWYENVAELVTFDPVFKQFQADGLKFNAQILESMSDIPVHPGVAKYYKEKGIWKNTWKIGAVETKNW